MNYADFDPYMIRERNEGLRREVSILRLEKRLWENRVPRSSRLIALTRRFRLPMRQLRTNSSGPHSGRSHTLKVNATDAAGLEEKKTLSLRW
jgi:hypothetical protein